MSSSDRVRATRLSRVGSCVKASAAVMSIIAWCGGMRSSIPLLMPHMIGIAAAGSRESGRIENLETVADLIKYNQDHHPGFSIPGEGHIQRSTGIISRWELPIPVYADSSIHGTNVAEALTYWQSVTGLSFVSVGKNAKSRLVVRAASARELNIAVGLGLVYRTYSNNRAQLGVVKIRDDFADCSSHCAGLYRHELGHAIGIFGHVAGGALMASPQVGTEASVREINMLVQLYRLPHGARIAPDGTWKVLP
jgi:hypothetical protein